MRVFVDCVGCEQRELDAQRCINATTVYGARVVPDPGNCQIAIIVTCAVSAWNEQESMRRLHDVVARMPVGAKLIVGGCLPTISPNLLKGLPVSATFSPRTVEECLTLLQEGNDIFKNVPMANRTIFDARHRLAKQEEGEGRGLYEAAKRGFKIVIAQGCRGRCSYCAVRRATGKFESVPERLILEQVKQAVAQAEPSVMLMAGDTGEYGRDLGIGLPELLGSILRERGHFDLFVHDLGAKSLIRDCESYRVLLEAIANSNRLRAICVPCQSGSDAVLERMNRGYKAGELLYALIQIRQSTHVPYIGTHVLVGFPGETEIEFSDTLDFLKLAEFDFLTCFAYSERQCTPSLKMYPKIPSGIIDRRLQLLMKTVNNVKIVR